MLILIDVFIMYFRTVAQYTPNVTINYPLKRNGADILSLSLCRLIYLWFHPFISIVYDMVELINLFSFHSSNKNDFFEVICMSEESNIDCSGNFHWKINNSFTECSLLAQWQGEGVKFPHLPLSSCSSQNETNKSIPIPFTVLMFCLV